MTASECSCVSHHQQQQHHVCMVTHARHVQSCPLVLVLQVDIQASLNQELCCEHVVVASTLQNANHLSVSSVYFLKHCQL